MSEHTDTVPLPRGWENAETRRLRLTDPGGTAVAWFAPDLGANCVGLAVRAHQAWRQIFHSEGPAALRERPSRFGCPILFPFPGHMLNARYTWHNVEYTLPPNGPTGDHFLHGFAHTRPWRVLRAESSAIVAEMSTDDLLASERSGYPFTVRLRLSLRLEEAALRIELEATNEGTEAAPVGLGLHPYFDPAIFGGDRTQARIHLPGRLARVPRPLSTGQTVPVTTPEVSVPPPGETVLVSRTDLGERPVVTVEGPASGPRLVMQLLDGVHDLLLFAPAEQPSISIEPLSLAPSAASQPEGDPAGLVGLAPGQQRRLAVLIRLEAE